MPSAHVHTCGRAHSSRFVCVCVYVCSLWICTADTHVIQMPAHEMHIYRIEILSYWLCKLCGERWHFACVFSRVCSLAHRVVAHRWFTETRPQWRVSPSSGWVCVYVVLFAQELQRDALMASTAAGSACGSTIDSSELRFVDIAHPRFRKDTHTHTHVQVFLAPAWCANRRETRAVAWLVRTIIISLFSVCWTVRDGDTVKHYRIRQLDEGGFFIARRTTFRWVLVQTYFLRLWVVYILWIQQGTVFNHVKKTSKKKYVYK